MSDIVITQKNISRFNKRLQKALKEHFKQEIALHLVSEFMAQAIGCKNVNELQTILSKKDQISIDEISSVSPIVSQFHKKAQEFIDEISKYFKENKTDLKNVSFIQYDDNYCLNIKSNSKKFNEVEGFGLYFEHAPSGYLDIEIKRIEHSAADYNFLKDICDKYFTKDVNENKFLGSIIAHRLNVRNDCDYFEFYSFQNILDEKLSRFDPQKHGGEFPLEFYGHTSLNKIGDCIKGFLIVSDDYFDKYLTSYKSHDANRAYVEKGSFKMYPTFQTAHQNLNKKEMILEFYKEQDEKNGYCSYYFHDNKFNLVADTEGFPIQYKEPADFYRFEGALARHENLTSKHNPYGINLEKHNWWKEGFSIEENSKPKLVKNNR